MTSAAGFRFSFATFSSMRAKQIEIAGDEARGSRPCPKRGPFDRPLDQGLVEAKREIVVAREIDVSAALHVDRAGLARGDSQQDPAQALLGRGSRKAWYRSSLPIMICISQQLHPRQ